MSEPQDLYQHTPSRRNVRLLMSGATVDACPGTRVCPGRFGAARNLPHRQMLGHHDNTLGPVFAWQHCHATAGATRAVVMTANPPRTAANGRQCRRVESAIGAPGCARTPSPTHAMSAAAENACGLALAFWHHSDEVIVDNPAHNGEPLAHSSHFCITDSYFRSAEAARIPSIRHPCPA
jgi:hypothetical protein